ncbi:MAG: DUF427 domain-containing protein [Myxococcota bacterium]
MEPVGPGEESVWDYPRPPEIRAAEGPLRVIFAGETVAETSRGLRVCETAGAPVYFFPPEDVSDGVLSPAPGGSVCEWKGLAAYFDVTVGGKVSKEAAFTYPDPFDDLRAAAGDARDFSRLAGWIAFYASRVDAAWIGDTQVAPQPGGFYAGWVAPWLRGPIKGSPGTGHW